MTIEELKNMTKEEKQAYHAALKIRSNARRAKENAKLVTITFERAHTSADVVRIAKAAGTDIIDARRFL